MFTKDDLKIDSFPQLLSFLLILPFVGLVAPFLMAVYSLGFLEDLVGWLDT
ncbi:MAG: hypothetical protein HYW48_01650 [Deltaproteobacteria bacterium]|nr:hypothetical protein [Deltaproteobacteria bacterium]